MKKFLILLFLLLPSIAHAQKTKSALTTEVNTNLASGSDISAATLRTTIIDIIDSYVDANGGSSLGCASHQWVAAIATLSSVTCTQPAITDISGLGTGVATALGTNTGLGGAFVLFNGALGTPTSGIISTGMTLGGVTMGLGSDATGDVYYNSGGVLTRLPKGSNGQVLELASGIPSWATVTGTGTVTTLTAGAGIAFSSGATCTTACTVSASNAMGSNKFQFFTTGSGTITTPTGAGWVKLTLVGGGGGGSGGGSTGGGNGSLGNATCVNTTGAACTSPVYSAGAGGGGLWASATGGAGGSTGGSSSCSAAIQGGSGVAGSAAVSTDTSNGGGGGNSTLGGAGAGVFNGTGAAGGINSGGGGQGGTGPIGTVGGAGGGAGATCVVFITSPAASYTYAVGNTSAGGTSGVGGTTGGAGAAGLLTAEFGYN